MRARQGRALKAGALKQDRCALQPIRDHIAFMKLYIAPWHRSSRRHTGAGAVRAVVGMLPARGPKRAHMSPVSSRREGHLAGTRLLMVATDKAGKLSSIAARLVRS